MTQFVTWLTAARYRMVLVASLAIIMAITQPLLMLPLMVVGQGVIVLAVLVRGLTEGLVIAVLVTLLMIVPPLVTGVATVPGAISAAVYWLAVLALALALGAVLLRTRSLSFTAQIATIFAVVAVTLIFLMGAPQEFWGRQLNQVIAALDGQIGEVPPALVSEFSRVFTGLLAGVALLTTMGAVFLGRWWHSSITDPGAFGNEFRTLRMGAVIGILAGVVFVAAGLTKVTMLENLSLLLASAFLLHGLAVVHAFAAVAVGSFWLVSVYVLLLVAAPFAGLAVAGLGFIDNWFDLRSRVVRR